MDGEMLMSIASQVGRIGGPHREDCISEVLLKLVQASKAHPEEAKDRPWLITVAKNARTDYLRKMRVRSVERTTDDGEQAERSEAKPEVSAPMQNYDNRYLVLYQIGFTMPMLGKLTGKSYSVVWKRIHKTLRQALTQEQQIA